MVANWLNKRGKIFTVGTKETGERPVATRTTKTLSKAIRAESSRKLNKVVALSVPVVVKESITSTA
jgi:hypothetical protein